MAEKVEDKILSAELYLPDRDSRSNETISLIERQLQQIQLNVSQILQNNFTEEYLTKDVKFSVESSLSIKKVCQTIQLFEHQARIFGKALLRAQYKDEDYKKYESGLLVNHDTGSGKTLTSLSLVIAFWDKFWLEKETKKPWCCIIMSTKDGVQGDNDIKKLAEKCITYFGTYSVNYLPADDTFTSWNYTSEKTAIFGLPFFTALNKDSTTTHKLFVEKLLTYRMRIGIESSLLSKFGALPSSSFYNRRFKNIRKDDYMLPKSLLLPFSMFGYDFKPHLKQTDLEQIKNDTKRTYTLSEDEENAYKDFIITTYLKPWYDEITNNTANLDAKNSSIIIRLYFIKKLLQIGADSLYKNEPKTAIKNLRDKVTSFTGYFEGVKIPNNELLFFLLDDKLGKEPKTKRVTLNKKFNALQGNYSDFDYKIEMFLKKLEHYMHEIFHFTRNMKTLKITKEPNDYLSKNDNSDGDNSNDEDTSQIVDNSDDEFDDQSEFSKDDELGAASYESKPLAFECGLDNKMEHCVFILDEITLLVNPPAQLNSIDRLKYAICKFALTFRRNLLSTWVVGLTATPGATVQEAGMVFNLLNVKKSFNEENPSIFFKQIQKETNLISRVSILGTVSAGFPKLLFKAHEIIEIAPGKSKVRDLFLTSLRTQANLINAFLKKGCKVPNLKDKVNRQAQNAWIELNSYNGFYYTNVRNNEDLPEKVLSTNVSSNDFEITKVIQKKRLKTFRQLSTYAEVLKDDFKRNKISELYSAVLELESPKKISYFVPTSKFLKVVNIIAEKLYSKNRIILHLNEMASELLPPIKFDFTWFPIKNNDYELFIETLKKSYEAQKDKESKEINPDSKEINPADIIKNLLLMGCSWFFMSDNKIVNSKQRSTAKKKLEMLQKLLTNTRSMQSTIDKFPYTKRLEVYSKSFDNLEFIASIMSIIEDTKISFENIFSEEDDKLILKKRKKELEEKTRYQKEKISDYKKPIKYPAVSFKGKIFIFCSSKQAIRAMALYLNHASKGCLQLVKKSDTLKTLIPESNKGIRYMTIVNDATGTTLYKPFADSNRKELNASLSKLLQASNKTYQDENIEELPTGTKADHPVNINGEICPVILATAEAFKGLDFAGLTDLMLMDPFLSVPDLLQFLGRGPRLCSHKDSERKNVCVTSFFTKITEDKEKLWREENIEKKKDVTSRLKNPVERKSASSSDCEDSEYEESVESEDSDENEIAEVEKTICLKDSITEYTTNEGIATKKLWQEKEPYIADFYLWNCAKEAINDFITPYKEAIKLAAFDKKEEKGSLDLDLYVTSLLDGSYQPKTYLNLLKNETITYLQTMREANSPFENNEEFEKTYDFHEFFLQPFWDTLLSKICEKSIEKSKSIVGVFIEESFEIDPTILDFFSITGIHLTELSTSIDANIDTHSWATKFLVTITKWRKLLVMYAKANLVLNRLNSSYTKEQNSHFSTYVKKFT